MSDPVDKEPPPSARHGDRPDDHDALKDHQIRGSGADGHAEMRRQWVAANRERVREMNRRWRATHLERARQLNRESMRQTADRKRREAERRSRGRERAKSWREAHPDRVRENKRHWAEENREKVREYQRRYYAAHRPEVSARAAARRDADPERMKRASRQWAERNKDRRAELQREHRRDPDAYEAVLQANATAKRLSRRLGRAGLPPKRLHPATAAERRANERDADAYFSDPQLSEHLRQRSVLTESLTEHMLKNGARMREFADAYAGRRARLGLPPVPVEDVMYARAVELAIERMRRIDLLTSRDVVAAVRSTKAAVAQEERKQQFDRLVNALAEHVDRNISRLSEDAAMENRARTRRGKPRAPVDSLVVQSAAQEIIQRVPTSRLTATHLRRAIRFAETKAVFPLGTDPDLGREQAGREPIG